MTTGKTDAQEEPGRILHVLRWVAVPVRKFWTDEEAIQGICRETLIKGTPENDALQDYLAFCRYRQRAYRGRIRWNHRREQVQIQQKVLLQGSYVFVCDTQSSQSRFRSGSEVD